MNPPEQLIDDLRLLEPAEPFRIDPWIVAGVLAALALVWWVSRWWRTTRGARHSARAMVKAQEDALAELERLFALIERGESRPYAQESSGIVRRYIEARFHLSAPRQSTEEFLEGAQNSPRLEPKHQDSLREFLRICDLLKFARTFANRDELTSLHGAAVNFVKETPYTSPAPAA